MSQATFVDGLWNGRPVEEWIPEIVDDVVEGFDPARVILFGSVTRGEAGSESDVDLLVLFDGAEIRLSDLGELAGALLLHHHRVHAVESIYPLTFSSPGPSAQPAGIDVVGVNIHAGAGPLLVDERLTVAEAKSTLDDDAGNAISGIQADVKKCNAERIADSLLVLKWEFEREGDLDHLRLHLFVTDHTSLVGSLVIDPLICDVDKTVASIFNRLDGKVTPAGAPLTRVLLLALPDASAFVEATL